MKTHDTFLFGITNDRIVFLKSYDYDKQKDEVDRDMDFVTSNFENLRISHVGNWKMEEKFANGESFSISIPIPF